MFKENRRHLQPALISNVNDLPEKQRVLLEASWSGVFFREFYCRVDEQPFAAISPRPPRRSQEPGTGSSFSVRDRTLTRQIWEI
ncbi:MAG: hypothetical protein ABIL11_18315 [Chloroflexota bacterium]